MNDNRYASYLAHWGIKGQQWGVRRYQYEDGGLTPEGLERYRYSNRANSRLERKIIRKMDRNESKRQAYEAEAMGNYNEYEDARGQSKAYKKASKKAADYMERVKAGADLLKTYRQMKVEDARALENGKIFASKQMLADLKTMRMKDLMANFNTADVYERDQLQRKIKALNKYK